MNINMHGDESPTPCKPAGQFTLHSDAESVMAGNLGIKRTSSAVSSREAVPLVTSKFGNQGRASSGETKKTTKKSKSSNSNSSDGVPVSLLSKLTVSQSNLSNSSTSSLQVGTPATAPYDNASSTGSGAGSAGFPEANPTEVLRLKKELEAAQDKIARMDQELSIRAITKHTIDQAMGPPSEVDFPVKHDVTEQTISNLQNVLNSSTRPGSGQSWFGHQDARSEMNEMQPTANSYNRSQAVWANSVKPNMALNVSGHMNPPFPMAAGGTWGSNNAGGGDRWAAAGNVVNTGPGMFRPQQFAPMPQNLPMPSRFELPRASNQSLNEPAHFPLQYGPVVGRQRGGYYAPSRPGSANDGYLGGSYTPSIASSDAMGTTPPMTPRPFPGMSMVPTSQLHQPQPIGTRLSPTAAEFNVGPVVPNGWHAQAPVENNAYTGIAEPMNYRRLLDRNMTCDWKYIVDKIVCSNDQQASIFLQQKLKVGTAEQKFEIVEAIIAQAFPLMINRFGNFLVQRCFEHGTPEQVVAIAKNIRGNTLNLSMDPFGCHVVQKAFDCVPEEYKAVMVHELLRRIPETVIHRYACHVWQKLFELRWSNSPPQIMKYVNEALRGMWHEVALGETGSLVVQNIFENCLDEDKRPAINEVLASIDVIAHGQFGNWCIQHICEHGAPADRSRAIEHILRFATEYSMDQYASKVIEKCLKIGGAEFLDRYLDRVTEGRPDRPRMPLIDIAGDQFGNYLVQYILTHANPQHRELVASHVRKHMVSLRGSKYGSRVAMLCCNPAFATRPGPPTGMQLQRGYSANSNYSSSTNGNSNRGGGYAAGYGTYR